MGVWGVGGAACAHVHTLSTPRHPSPGVHADDRRQGEALRKRSLHPDTAEVAKLFRFCALIKVPLLVYKKRYLGKR